jgi:pSer/pThr/pTyr-binding forkhead associated (FHA) protein
MASLVGRDGKRFTLSATRRITIGRSSDNDIVLQHSSVSRHQATVQCISRQFSIKDLNSRNGTWVGNRKVNELRLFDGDIVRFGDVELVFENRAQGRVDDVARMPTRHRARSFAGRAGKSAVALCALFILGLGVAELILHPLDTTNPAPPPPQAHAKALSSNDGIPPIVVGRAIIETDRKHMDDSSWIAVDPTAQMCNQGALPPDSIFCRVAYLGRHAEGKDLDHGPPTVAAADVAEFCSRGAIDPKSPVCAQASGRSATSSWP